ncbi:MAG: arsenate reductase [Sulfitobacter sp.]|nr:arsenate reductase [Sulfitobacter sp.]
MKLIIYGLKNCDQCRKARKALPDAQEVDVRAEGVPDVVLEDAFSQFGAQLINTRSTTWRELDPAARETAPLALLKAHPTLMKRPLIQAEDRLFLSWNSGIEADVKAML